MRKTSVKPHILSWLQPAPKALGKIIELSPTLATAKSKSKRADSVFITNSCLGATTASGILGMHRKPPMEWRSIIRFMFQIAAALGLVFLLSPAKTPNVKIASQPRPAGNPTVLKTFPSYTDVTVRN